MNKKFLVLTLVLILVVAIPLAIAVLTQQLKLQSSGTIIQPLMKVQVYDEMHPDAGKEFKNGDSITWGQVMVGKSVDYMPPFLITNLSDKTITLSVTAINWSPGVSGKVSLSVSDIAPKTQRLVILTLTIDSTTETSFTNEILFTATQA